MRPEPSERQAFWPFEMTPAAARQQGILFVVRLKGKPKFFRDENTAKSVARSSGSSVEHINDFLKSQAFSPHLMVQARRIASRHMKANTQQALQSINSNLASVTSWKDALADMSATLHALIAAGEARRLGRTLDIKVLTAAYDGNRINAVMQGVTDKYQTRITLKPKRGHRCSCPDWIDNGMHIGPCKHVLALGQHWLAEKVIPALDNIDAHLVHILEKSSL